MAKSTKAALLSALIFPGAGHFMLKRYVSSAVLAGAALSGLYYLVSETVERAMQISEKIQSGEIQIDVAEITALVSKQSTGAEAHTLNIATTVLIISWLIGIVDSYRVGQQQDKEVAK